jgi:hypothetical protein
MTKKALRIISEEAPAQRLTQVGSRTAAPIQAQGCCGGCESEEPQQVFSSEEQALDFLLGSIVDKLGDDSVAKAEMADFLTMLLDTDPELKEEVLSGVAIRSSSETV